MDNWPPIVALTLALTGGVYLLSRPLPLDYKNREYQRHLTREEVAFLKRGEPIEKTHKAFQSILHDYYDEGPLHVLPTHPKGQVHISALWSVAAPAHQRLALGRAYPDQLDVGKPLARVFA